MECRAWEDLTREVLVEIFSRLGFEERYVNVALVCKSWSRAARDSACWKVADIDECFQSRQECARWWTPSFGSMIDAMVINVASWSSGSLCELHTRHCSDEALSFVADRCPRLHSLSVKESPGFTDLSAVIVARKCPELRHLDITGCQHISDRSLKELGLGCKRLVTLRRNMLTLENNWQRRQVIPWDYLSVKPESSADEEAATISSTMAELETLEFRFSGLTDAGLEWITGGCSKLQHLGLFGCKSLSIVALDSAAEKLPHVKVLERPTPAVANYIDSLRYGHWQLYSERFQPSFQF